MYWFYCLYGTLSIICRTMESAYRSSLHRLRGCTGVFRTCHVKMSRHVTSWIPGLSLLGDPERERLRSLLLLAMPGHLLRWFRKKGSTANSTQKWLNWETNDCWHLNVWSFFDTLKHLKRKEDLGLVWLATRLTINVLAKLQQESVCWENVIRLDTNFLSWTWTFHLAPSRTLA